MDGKTSIGLTDANGTAEVYPQLPSAKGVYPYTVTFEGDDNTYGSSLTGNWTR
jgi:hypothetical protein